MEHLDLGVVDANAALGGDEVPERKAVKPLSDLFTEMFHYRLCTPCFARFVIFTFTTAAVSAGNWLSQLSVFTT